MHVFADFGYALLNFTDWPAEKTTVIVRDGEQEAWNYSSDLSGDQTLFVPFLEPGRELTVEVTSLTERRQAKFRTLPAPPFAELGQIDIIQPGSRIYGLGFCTLAFILRDATNHSLYAFTAGHCVGEVNETVLDAENRNEFGVVAMRGPSLDEDWALIKLHEFVRPRINPSLPTWGGPTRDVTPAKPGDVVTYHGWGTYTSLVVDYKSRRGHFIGYGPGPGYSENAFAILGEASGGDSGSPIISGVTGAPLGILVSVQGLTSATSIPIVMKAIRGRGLELQILTAPWASPQQPA